MEKALSDLVMLGVPNNIDYLARIMRNPAFLSGKLHTGFLPQEAATLIAPDPTAEEQIVAVLAAAFVDVDFRRIVYDIPEPHASIGFWRN
jgi:propionyl-CoA carboxylase alpha chain/3-methylcrotonyl-CoA carboxylase alpha subunit/acetyl-CoA/propionyl-CoA carboxylase biotin carboxyl carrier protein